MAKLRDAMELFVVLQRNSDSPGLYFVLNFESLHFPQDLKLFVPFRTQQNQYFCIWIISLISKSPKIHHSPHTVLHSKASMMYTTCVKDTAVKLWGVPTCSSGSDPCRSKPIRPKLLIPRIQIGFSSSI